MQTRKLYYEDSHLAAFTARVLSCTPTEKDYEVVLDATAFYPEGGGQAADTGTLGGVRVLDTRERGETVVHLCEQPLEPGQTVEGRIDWERRFDRMQQHSGEHIVSGIIHRRFGGIRSGSQWRGVGQSAPAHLVSIPGGTAQGALPHEKGPALACADCGGARVRHLRLLRYPCQRHGGDRRD